MKSEIPQCAVDRVRRVTAEDLHQLLGWRNHPDVRSFMFTSREIPWEEHVAWFERCEAETKRHLLMFEAEGVPSGFVNLHEVRAGGISDWGFFVAPGSPRGTGTRLGKAALNYAFHICGLHKVCGQALAYNDRSITFHRRLGFKEEGMLRDQFFDGGAYIDVVTFGLLANEYLIARKEG
jgi:UDP-4-amino-4,6-dideoxy-N-acetyl-beta-L-altrosamine N-acetyltransferase